MCSPEQCGRRGHKNGANYNFMIFSSQLVIRRPLPLGMGRKYHPPLGGPREQRYERHSWAFFQLRQFISYKADREGIAVILVDPAYTSQTCHMCGHCEKANRRTQSEFSCQRCGFTMNADANAAINIKTVAVNQPMVSPLGRCVVRVDTSPLL